MRSITNEELDHWRTHGFVIVRDLLGSQEVNAAVENVGHYAPTWEEYSRRPQRYPWVGSPEVFKLIEAPFTGEALNDLMTAPAIVDFGERALGQRDLFLTQSILWPKYSRSANYEQPFHLDYHDNTLAVPSSDAAYEQLAVIIYLTDVSKELGSTRIVSLADSQHLPLYPYERSRELNPELYEKEIVVEAPAGTALFFTSRTWHRGSAITADDVHRYSLHLAFRRGGQEWMSWRGWAKELDRSESSRFMARATPRQRELLGFPPVDHPFWTDETITLTQQRYSGIDMSPYRTAFERNTDISVGGRAGA